MLFLLFLIMVPTTMELVMTVLLGGISAIVIIVVLGLYFLTRKKSYKDVRLHPERYGKFEETYKF